jgi:hypothetical protein
MKNTFLDYVSSINESSSTIVYHGDDFNTTKLEPKWMLHKDSNNQEGVGIYFSIRPETAKSYGKNIVAAEINHKNFIDSRSELGKINSKKIVNLMKYLHSLDNEPLWYLLTDYGFEVYKPEDVEDWHFLELYKKMKTEHIRNFQIELAQKFNTEDFVKAWNKFVKIDGTFQKQPNGDVWYAIINTDIKISKYRE